MRFPLHTPEKKQYCELWQCNAATFADQGCYSWMVEQLTQYSPRRILDIGCGTGEGLIAMLQGSVKSVVVLEENFDCIKITEQKLLALGYEVSVVPRIGYDEDYNDRHDLIINHEEKIETLSQITIIHADPLLIEADQQLKHFLTNTPKFDAVTVWLIGTYNARKTCKTLDCFQITDPKHYRLLLQNKIYELADQILISGGVLHVVDRGLTPDTDSLREMTFKLHQEQASITSLEVTNFAHRSYKEPEERGIGMTRSMEDNPTLIDDGRRAMQSIISVRSNNETLTSRPS